MSTPVAAAIAVAVALAGTRAAAAEPAVCHGRNFELAPPQYDFMPRNYFFGSPSSLRRDGGDRSLIFETQLALHLPIIGLGIGRDPRCDSGYGSLFFMPSIMFRMRMLDTPSLPVIPFSGMPTPFQAQYLHRWILTDDGKPTSEWLLGITPVIWAHHSNGQDGCFWSGQTRDEAGDCQGPEEGINERNGTFSTNYSAISFAGRYSELAAFDGPRWSIAGSVSWQHHHADSWFPGGLEPEMKGLWGLDRWIVGGEYRRYRITDHKWNGYLAAEVEAVLPRVEQLQVKNYRATVEAAAFPPTRYSRFGIFVGFVSGQDYYNILFTETVRMVRVGIVLDTSSLWPGLENLPSPHPSARPGGEPVESTRPTGDH